VQFDPDTDLYAILEVAPTAPGVVIRAAHGALLELYSDDKPRRALVNQAYNVLAQPDLRHQYDTFRDAQKAAREGAENVAVLCPNCGTRNELSPARDNRAAVCGVCRAPFSKDLDTKVLRAKARKTVTAAVQRRGDLPPQKLYVLGGAALLVLALVGVGLFLVPQLKLSGLSAVRLPAPPGPGAAPPAGAPAPAFPAIPVVAGQRVEAAVSSLTAAGWAIGARYDVTASGGSQHVVEATKNGFNARFYFRDGKLAEAEKF